MGEREGGGGGGGRREDEGRGHSLLTMNHVWTSRAQRNNSSVQFQGGGGSDKMTHASYKQRKEIDG